MIDLSKYRIIDLSHELIPSEQKTDGHHRHGKPINGRPVELSEFYHSDDNARMHFIRSQTHNGTHVEASYKFSETGADLASMPIETYLGEAVACNFTQKAGHPLTPDDFKKAGVKQNDIVLAWSGPDGAYLTFEAVDWLVEIGIKALGLENISLAPPGTPLDQSPTPDAKLLLAGIGFIDNGRGFDQITKPRVFFIGLPVRMRRATAFWTRAIVLEEL